MKKKLVLSAMLVSLLALGLSLPGCPTEDDDNDGGGGGGGGSKGVNATIRMTDLGNNSFTLTLAGARWKPEDDINFGLVVGITSSYMNCAYWGSGSSLGYTRVNQTVTRISDTELTIVMEKKQNITGTGTIILKDNDLWADIMGNANTYGQLFLWYMTQDGFDDGTGKYHGTVTVAEGSDTSLTITIN
jgi:hypothetical protein